ncbi:hypothetical protein QYM36_000570, partial [Artemia franciscana]
MNNERGQKLVLATSQEVTDYVVRRERRELEFQKSHNEDDQNKKAKFIKEALGLLEKRENQLAAEVRLQKRGNSAEVPLEDFDMMEELELEEQEIHYFYQADDGQNIYLHDVCSQMLKHEYGSLQTAPRVLSGKIIQQETYSMTPELRSHLRYLKHLPVPTVFVVIKVELDDCVISQETFDHFRDRFPEREERLRSKDHVEIKPLGSSLHFPSCSRDELRHGDEPGHSQPQESEEVQFLPSHRWQREPSPAWQLQPLDLLGEDRFHQPEVQRQDRRRLLDIERRRKWLRNQNEARREKPHHYPKPLDISALIDDCLIA